MSHAYRVKPGSKLSLSDIPYESPKGLSKADGQERLERLGEQLGELLELLFAAGKNGLLIVLQGRDTAGKDGSIRRILEFSNVQSTRVASFKVPTPLELSHDFLWRVHHQAPGKGEVVFFNRSHYEDVLVVRVHEIVPEEVWRGRYAHINAFEKLLADSGTIIVKFMLHITIEEQEQRLLDREKEVEKAWKLAAKDWKERAHWDAYTDAYEEALERCSTDHAPWHVIPANDKWFRDLAIAETLVEALEPYKKSWLESLEKVGAAARAELAEMRAQKP